MDMLTDTFSDLEDAFADKGLNVVVTFEALELGLQAGCGLQDDTWWGTSEEHPFKDVSGLHLGTSQI